MSTTLAVLRMEFTGRARLFVVAIVMGLVPFAVAAMPSLRSQRGEVMVTVAMFVAIIYSAALATAFGASTIVGPLVDKRLAFYLAKPIPASSLWIGKFAAAMLISATVFAIVSIPARLFAPDATPWGVSDSNLSQLALMALPVFFLVTHALATMVRSRSIRLAVDLILLFAVIGALFLIGRVLFAGGALVALGLLFAGVGLALLIVLAIAPIYQIFRGRVESRRSHAAFSNFLWIAMAVIVAGAALYSAWVASAPLSSIRNFGALAQTADGQWFLAAGETDRGGYHTAWLVNTSSGEKRRLGGTAPWGRGMLSSDGSTVVSVRLNDLDPRRVSSEIVLTPIETGGRTGSIIVDGWLGELALTPDASRIALDLGRHVAVYDVASSTRLAVAPRENRRILQLGFVSNDLLRIVTSGFDIKDVRIHDLDLKTRALRTVGGLPDGVWPTFSGDFSRMLVRQKRGPTTRREFSASVADGRSGATLFPLPAANTHTLLADGRAAYLTLTDGKARLHVTDASGAESKVIDVPDSLQFAGQAGEKVILEARNAIVVVDLRNGSVRRLEGASAGRSYVDGRLAQYEEEGLIVGFDEQRKLAAWSLVTGEKKGL